MLALAHVLFAQVLVALPLVAPTAGTVAAAPPSAAPSAAAAEPLRFRLPRAVVRTALESALVDQGRLKRFQLGTSKFTDGHVRLEDFELLPSEIAGTARFEVHGALDYARRQLGIQWRGLKSHKKWFDKGRKDVARVRLTGTVRLTAGGALVATDLRVKIVSRLTPARGLTARFDLDDRRFDLPREGFGGLLLQRLRIERSTREALHLVVRPPEG